MGKKHKILYLIHLPPPVHGVSTICKQVIETDFKSIPIEKAIIKLNLSDSIYQLRRFSVDKIFRLILIIIKLAYKLLVFRPDFVYFSIMPIGKGFLKDSILVILIKLFSIKIIFHIHNKGIPGYYKKSLYKRLLNNVFKNSYAIHLSEHLKKTELDIINTHGLKTFVIPNGIDALKYLPNKKEKNNELNVVFLANLIPEKGFMTCLKALKILVENSYKQVKLTIAGSPTKDFDNTLTSFLNSNHKLKKNLNITGAVFNKEKEKIYNMADVFIFPSRFTQECMPLVILEAMSVGKPIIASNIGAIPDMVIDNINGFLISTGNEQQLADRIKIFIDKPELVDKFGEESKRIFQSKYARQHFTKRLEQVFLEITNS